MTRRRAIATGLATASAAIVLPAGGHAAPLSDCTAHHGTIVAVDFGHWNGPVVRGCGTGRSTGFALLHAAGFTTAGDQHDGPAFVCRMGDSAFRGGSQYPTPSEDLCITTPPTNAYWSFWVAAPGMSTWSYSSLGATSHVAAPGEVELWTFGATDTSGSAGSGRPRINPATLRPRQLATATHTTSTRTAAVQATTHPPVGVATSATTTTHSATVRPRAAPHRRPHRAAPAGTPAKTAAARTPVAATVPIVAAQPTRLKASSGSPMSVAVGGVIAIALAAGAAWTAWRRRHA